MQEKMTCLKTEEECHLMWSDTDWSIDFYHYHCLQSPTKITVLNWGTLLHCRNHFAKIDTCTEDLNLHFFWVSP